MDFIQKPFIKQGWLRAFLYTIVVFFVMMFFQQLALAALTKISGDAGASSESSIQNFILVYSIISVGILLVTWFFRKLVDRQTFASLGFEWNGFTNEAWLGFFSGPAILGIGTMVLVVAGYITFIGYEIPGNTFLLEFLAMIIVAFVEELLFRGYLLNNLMQSVNKWIALAITAALFGLFHGANPDVTALALVNILIAGLFLGINYIYTRNLWFSIFFHFSWNFFQGPVLGYEVSGLQLQSIFKQSVSGPSLFTGGQFGFEGSVLCPLLLTAFILLFAYIFSRRYAVAKMDD